MNSNFLWIYNIMQEAQNKYLITLKTDQQNGKICMFFQADYFV